MNHRGGLSVGLLVLTCVLGLLVHGQSEVPRQFRVWGRKAPLYLGAYNPVPGERGLRSIRIPKGYKQIQPSTNLTDPAVPDAYRSLGYLPFSYHPMVYVYAETRPQPRDIGRPMRAIATPGEYVPLAFAVRALAPMYCVDVEVSAFSSKSGKVVIPRSHVDLRIVRDLPLPTREKGEYVIAPRYLESFDEFDILNVPAGRTERFWLTVKVPESAEPGIARGKVRIRTRNGQAYELKTMIRILPFKLAVPDPEREMNFQILSNGNDARFGSWGRNNCPEHLHRVFVDMIEHGMCSNNYEHVNPHVAKDADGKLSFDFDKPGLTCYWSMNDFMHIFRRAGFTGPFCHYAGPYEWAQYLVPSYLKLPMYSEAYNQALRAITAAVEAQRKAKGWPDFIFFLGDEPGASASRVKLNMNLGRQVKAAVPGSVTSNFFNGEWNGVRDWKILKEVTDINCTNYVNEATIRDSKKLGYQRLWIYNGIENYLKDTRGERLFYGFHPWKIGARGVTQYKYRAIYDGARGEVIGFTAYDQLNGGTASNHDFTYPTAEGPLPTPKWEAVRQGIYDYRYLLTLKKKIDAQAGTEVAKKAQAALDELMTKFELDYQTEHRGELLPNYSPETLDVYRWRVSQQIMNLQKAGR